MAAGGIRGAGSCQAGGAAGERSGDWVMPVTRDFRETAKAVTCRCERLLAGRLAKYGSECRL